MAETVVPFEQIEAAYRRSAEKIRDLRVKAEEAAAPILLEIAEIEKRQQARENYILMGSDISAFGFITALFLNGRDDKAIAKKKAEDFSVDMKKTEAWLLKMLSKVGKSVSTDFGTVYKTRKEAVGVADFDAYCNAEIFRPAAEKLVEGLKGNLLSDIIHAEEVGNDPIEIVLEVLKTAAHIEALNKAANKTYVLEAMGDLDEKTSSRPNPVPSGIDYKAFAAVGVRKPTK